MALIEVKIHAPLVNAMLIFGFNTIGYKRIGLYVLLLQSFFQLRLGAGESCALTYIVAGIKEGNKKNYYHPYKYLLRSTHV